MSVTQSAAKPQAGASTATVGLELQSADAATRQVALHLPTTDHEDLSDFVKESPGRCHSAKEGALGMERLSSVGVTGGVEAVVPPPPGLPPNFLRQRRASTSASSIALSAWETEGEQSAD